MKNKISKLTLTFLIFCAIVSNAQQLKQTIRGTVIDKISHTPLPGANVLVMNSNPLLGASTDATGNFKIADVPVGKQSLRISFIGYKEIVLQNIDVNSGKEVVLNISLEENYVQAKEAVVTAKVEKNKALNDMAVVSARTFSVEETQKYAAAVNDPARMVSSYAGVIGTDDGNNDISIRGNSPNGLLWRMEGVDIPNPNHFSSAGSSGGGISILSSQLLTNSDFLTGAFPAEYGNALSGVFDLKLRKGNNEKNEYTFAAGFLGIDAAAEGPFKKGYSGAYLINYRYSTLSMLSLIGVPVGDGVTNFQDLSFNVSLPTNHYGNFSLFGFGGLSSQSYNAVKDSTKWKSDDETYNAKFFSNTGAVGLTHSLVMNSKTYLKSAIVASNAGNGFKASTLNNEYSPELKYNEDGDQTKFTLSSTLNHKFNSKQSLRAGFVFDRIDYNIKHQEYLNSVGGLVTSINAKGSLYFFQAFAETQYHFTNKLTANVGVHFSELISNSTYAFEPRASLKYEINNRQSISFGYGLHSQLQPTGVYFAEFNSGSNSVRPNEKLGLSKSQHFVLSYDRSLTEYVHAKVEAYYQSLYNIPVRADVNNSFSMLNVDDGYITDPLTNKGTGRNVGMELTFEQFLHHDFYYLLSASLYDSKYKGSDNVEHNTRYNGNYAFTFTAGKEFKTGDRFKNRIVGLNLKTIYRGGFRDTPINVDSSQSLSIPGTVYYDDEAFTIKNPAYFRTDIRVSLKRNRKKTTQTLALDIQNVTNRQNIYNQYYDAQTNSIKKYYQAGLIPILSYKIEF